jgi:hypothetical protein
VRKTSTGWTLHDVEVDDEQTIIDQKFNRSGACNLHKVSTLNIRHHFFRKENDLRNATQDGSTERAGQFYIHSDDQELS